MRIACYELTIHHTIQITAALLCTIDFCVAYGYDDIIREHKQCLLESIKMPSLPSVCGHFSYGAYAVVTYQQKTTKRSPARQTITLQYLCVSVRVIRDILYRCACVVYTLSLALA